MTDTDDDTGLISAALVATEAFLSLPVDLPPDIGAGAVLLYDAIIRRAKPALTANVRNQEHLARLYDVEAAARKIRGKLGLPSVE